jgi:hypothetical protein
MIGMIGMKIQPPVHMLHTCLAHKKRLSAAQLFFSAEFPSV